MSLCLLAWLLVSSWFGFAAWMHFDEYDVANGVVFGLFWWLLIPAKVISHFTFPEE